jgi:hypothetical protein
MQALGQSQFESSGKSFFVCSPLPVQTSASVIRGDGDWRRFSNRRVVQYRLVPAT